MKKLWIAVCVLVVALALGSAALAEDMLSVTAEANPTVVKPGDVISVTIVVQNKDAKGEAIEATLLDPEGKICTTFGTGGTAPIHPGGDARYMGRWKVTEAQLDAGRAVYSLRYAVRDTTGQEVQATRPIALPLEPSATGPDAKLNIERFIEPGSVAEAVTIRYAIRNVGTLDVMDIRIMDPEIIDAPVVCESLPVGTQAELFYSYIAGDAPRTTQASVFYAYALGGERLEAKGVMVGPAVTIDTAVPDIDVALDEK